MPQEIILIILTLIKSIGPVWWLSHWSLDQAAIGLFGIKLVSLNNPW